MKNSHPEFTSDVFVLLETVGATLTIRGTTGLESTISPAEFLQTNMFKKVILNITFPSKTKDTYYLRTFKIMPRGQNAHAIVNAGFLFNFDPEDKMKKVTATPSIVFGGISPKFVHATNLEQQIVGKSLLNEKDFQDALGILSKELVPTISTTPGSIHQTPEPDFDTTYRKQLALSLFYKFALGLSKEEINPKYISGSKAIQDERPVSDGDLVFDTDKKMWPLTKPVPKIDGLVQCAGEAEYVNDIPRVEGELFAAVLMADRGPAKIKSIDTSKALKHPGVHEFVSAKFIQGKNVIVEISETEAIFADKEIKFAGQFIGAIVADTYQNAIDAVNLIEVTYTDVKKPEFNLRKIVESGNTDRIKKGAEVTPTATKNNRAHKFKGTVELGGQYYYTMEPQTALGGYGSKLSRSCFPAVIAAVCSNVVNKPVKIVMPIETMTTGLGRRYSIYATYEGAVDDNGVIQTLNSAINVDEGASMNESSVEVMALGLRQTCPYDSSTFNIVLNSVLTDTPTTTWVRSPGATEIAAYLEHIMEHIAMVLKKDSSEVRIANYSLPQATSLLKQVKSSSNYDERSKAVETFNKV
ncbi:xanthine dehydrogenase 2-like, partial [Diaphorina citri]|uniref:Xanthine dehydrogenase 2-like n=1 Tax=Diaphorina citri TaxID=121845 RepID=A0A3Q0JHS8_DIACI